MALYIIAAIYGLLIGNYLTTAYFRIPRSIPINGFNKVGKLPHCSQCGHDLKFYEYFPLLSWIFTRFKCNYCNASINKIYTILEIVVMVISVVLLKFLGMNSFYAISVLVGATITLNIALFFAYFRFYTKAISAFLISFLIMVLI